MIRLSLLFLILLVTTNYAQIGPDGTGTVNGYSIGPGADLSFADLSNANLSNANLSGAILTFSDLSGAILTFSDLSGADLSGAILEFANLLDTILISADLSGADLTGANLTDARLIGANLINADLSGADLSFADLSNAILEFANLLDTILEFANLSGASLTGVISGNINGTPTLPSGYQMINGYIVGAGVDLTGANLEGADLTGADLTGVISANIISTPTLPTGYNIVSGYIVGPDANLFQANLSNANLSNVNLSNANLEGANLEGADLSGAVLSGANLNSANLTGTIWTNVISQSDYDAVVSERDAALAAQATAEAERDAKLTLDEVKDLRAGSTMIAVENETATLSMEIEKSSDLSNWTFDRTTTVDIPIGDEVGTQFFRFKMADPDTTVTVTVGEDTIAGRPIGVFYFNGAEKAVLEFEKGTKYTFIQNDSSNATYASIHHPLMFSTGDDGEHNDHGHFMSGVVFKLDGVTKTMAEYVSGFVAAIDRRIEWTVPSDAPSTLYYWCHFHTGQGAAMTVTD